MSTHPQVLKFQQVSSSLLSALDAQQQARAAYDQARDQYDDQRQHLILKGLPALRERCPAEEREAHLASALKSHTAALREARDALRRADTALEAARVQERAERETLRSLQRDLEVQAAHAHPKVV